MRVGGGLCLGVCGSLSRSGGHLYDGRTTSLEISSGKICSIELLFELSVGLKQYPRTLQNYNLTLIKYSSREAKTHFLPPSPVVALHRSCLRLPSAASCTTPLRPCIPHNHSIAARLRRPARRLQTPSVAACCHRLRNPSVVCYCIPPSRRLHTPLWPPEDHLRCRLQTPSAA